uniref:Decapping nuclease n=1 Tax=Musca domestica TaxID=7370 RepID=A0A1I8MVW1_MUSDO
MKKLHYSVMANRGKKNVLMQVNGHNVLEFKKSKTIFETPKIEGLYSYIYESFEPSKHIKYFKEPQPSLYPIDLNVGLEKACPVINSRIATRLHMPLNFAMKDSTTYQRPTTATTVYTSRRVLTLLMEFCYGKYNSHVLVSRHNGNLYMAGDPAADMDTPQQFHHKRLEQCLFADSPDELPKMDQPIDMNIALSCLHHAYLGKFSLLYAGEVQGIISDKMLENINDMDLLNQCRFVFSKQMWEWSKKEYKFLRYWIQSRLSNVDDIYVACKDKDGIVKKPIEHCKVSDIPKNYPWEPEVCFGFLHAFLERVENLMHGVNSLETVYEFQLNPPTKEITYEIYNGRTDKTFIPKYYADFVNN